MNVTPTLLNEQEQIEFRQWEEFFKHAGYARMVQTATEELRSVETTILNSVETERSLFYYQGQRSKLLALVNMEKSMEQYFTQLVADAELSRDDDEESFGANA